VPEIPRAVATGRHRNLRCDRPAHPFLKRGEKSVDDSNGTRYPWSRWRALLLDDPLQHNDVIHTAAFADVMRNLVSLEGYQVIMSSHDTVETDFIERKFTAAALPCVVVQLLGD
jgi:hypothetical protein